MRHSFSQTGRVADVYIYGDITSEPWNPGDASAISVVQAIKELDADVINLHIDSFGGDVAEGWGMYNALKQHSAKVVTFADGFVASAALYPFLAGEQRFASSVSAFFLHEVSSGAFGYADDLRKQADALDTMTELGINAFVEAAGMDAETVRTLMEAETWLSPEQAKQYGIVTDIMETKPQGVEQSAREVILKQLFTPAKKEEPRKTIFNLK